MYPSDHQVTGRSIAAAVLMKKADRTAGAPTEVTEVIGECLRQSVTNAAISALCLFSLQAENRFFVAVVLKKKMTEAQEVMKIIKSILSL
jgi:hypothetical protein